MLRLQNNRTHFERLSESLCNGRSLIKMSYFCQSQICKSGKIQDETREEAIVNFKQYLLNKIDIMTAKQMQKNPKTKHTTDEEDGKKQGIKEISTEVARFS